MIQLYDKIKDCPGRFHSWFNSSIGIIRKPNFAVDIKAEEIIKTIKIMEETKKVLWFLPADKAWAREIRRFVAIFFFAGISVVTQEVLASYSVYIPTIMVPLITGGLAFIDKLVRELKEKK